MSRARSLLTASLLSSSLLCLGCGPADPATAAPDVGVALRWHGSWAPAAQAALRAVVEDAPRDGRSFRVTELRATVLVDLYAADAAAPAHQAAATREATADGLRIALYPEATESLLRAGVELDRALGLGRAAELRPAGDEPGAGTVDRMRAQLPDGPGPGLGREDRLRADGPTSPGPGLGVSSR